MANSNTPSVGETGEPKSEFSGHTMERARGGMAHLVTFLAASAVAGVTGVAKEAEAGQCEMPAASAEQSRQVRLELDRDTTSCVTLTPRSDGGVDVQAAMSVGNLNWNGGWVLYPGDSSRSQFGHDLIVSAQEMVHLNSFIRGRDIVLVLERQNRATRRRIGGADREVTPLPAYTPPTQTPAPAPTPVPGSDASSTAQPPVTSTPPIATAVVPSAPRTPNPAEIFSNLPTEFRIHARVEPAPNRASGQTSGPILSAQASFGRGKLRQLQFDRDQLPVPNGMDLENTLEAPDGNGGLYVYAGKSVSGMGAPYNAVYRAHAPRSDQPQYLYFGRIWPSQGSDLGSGGPQELNIEAVISVQDGEFSMRPRESSNLGVQCDLIAQQPDEGVIGSAPVLAQCDLPGTRGHARYAGALMIDYMSLTDPQAIAALIRDRRLAIANRQAPADVAAEGVDVASVPMVLRRMRALLTPLLPAGVYVLDEAAIRHFVRPNYTPTNPAAPGTAPEPAVAPPAPLPSGPVMPATPSSNQPPQGFRPHHRVQNRRAA